MRRLLLTTLCLCLSACGAPEPDPNISNQIESALSTTAPTEALSDIINTRAADLNIPANTLTYQLADAPPISVFTGDGIDQNSLFQAASLSKAVAAYGILVLAERENIGLDDDIRPLTPSLDFEAIPGGDQPLTLRELLSHTAGASQPGFPGYPKKWREAGTLPSSVEIVTHPPHRFVDPVRLTGAKGKFNYSGGGYQIAQVFAEDVSEQPFAEIMKTLVFDPLAMTHSTFSHPIDPDEIAPLKIAAARSSFRPSEGVFKGFKSDWYDYPEQAAAGLWTTSSDYTIFAEAILRAWEGKASPVSKEIADTMLTPIDQSYGMGLLISTVDGKTVGFGHSGLNTGYRALFRVEMEPRFIVTSLSNAPHGHVINTEIIEAVKSRAAAIP